MNNAKAEIQDAARDAMVTAMFLEGLDDEYNVALNELYNDFLKGNDRYPKTIAAAVTMLKSREDIPRRRGHSNFAQQGFTEDSDVEDEATVDEEESSVGSDPKDIAWNYVPKKKK